MKRILSVLFAWLAAIHLAFAAVDINTAGEAELDKLPGIGPAKAKAIVEDRAKNGPFKSVEDLKRVKGIGDKTLDDLKGQITVGGGRAAPAPKAEGKALPHAAPPAVETTRPAPGTVVPKPAGAAAAAPPVAKPAESKSSAPPAPAGAKPPAPASATKPVEAKPAGAPPAPAGAAAAKKPAQDDKPVDKK